MAETEAELVDRFEATQAAQAESNQTIVDHLKRILHSQRTLMLTRWFNTAILLAALYLAHQYVRDQHADIQSRVEASRTNQVLLTNQAATLKEIESVTSPAARAAQDAAVTTEIHGAVCDVVRAASAIAPNIPIPAYCVIP